MSLLLLSLLLLVVLVLLCSMSLSRRYTDRQQGQVTGWDSSVCQAKMDMACWLAGYSMLLLYVCLSVCEWVVCGRAVAELWKRGNRAQEEAKGGQSGYKAGCGWAWMGMRGVCRVTLLARCEVLALAAWHGMVFHSTTYLHTSLPALPDTHTHQARPRRQTTRESSRPCFARDAANGASTDTQELQAPPILPWAHCGTEADGKVGNG